MSRPALIGAAPDVFASQPDMLPSQWRHMLGEFRPYIATLAAELGESAFEIDRVTVLQG